MSRLLAFLFLCGQATAAAICLEVETERCEGNQCFVEIGQGTATTLHEAKPGTWIAITARHNFGPPGSRVKSVKVAVDDEWKTVSGWWPVPDNDAAVIQFDCREKFKNRKCNFDPQPGEKIVFVGYPDKVASRTIHGTLTQSSTDDGCLVAQAKSGVFKGQSGGPVYDANGNVIGIVSARALMDHKQLSFVPMSRIEKACRREWGYFWGIGIGMRPPVPQAFQRAHGEHAPDCPNHPSKKSAGQPQADAAPPPPVETKPEQPPQPQANYSGEIESLKAEIARLQSQRIPVQILNPDGTIHDQATYKIGNPIKLKLSPVKK